jgi:FG-GAP-like repeat
MLRRHVPSAAPALANEPASHLPPAPASPGAGRAARRRRPRRIAGAAALAAAACLASAATAVSAQTNAPVKWTVTLSGSGWVQFSKPILADLDGTGQLSVIVGTSPPSGGPGLVYVINHDGTIRTGWPQSMPLPIFSSAAVGDLLGDGGREIVIGSGNNTEVGTAATVTAFHTNGTVLWSFTPPIGSSPTGNDVVSSPAIGDLSGNGTMDVVFGSFNQYVYALNGKTGTVLPGWPVFVYDSVWSSPALADLDGSGALEVIIGSESHSQPSPINSSNGGALWVFRANGTNFPGFPKYLTPIGIDSSPAVGDIDGDGCPEIVVGTTTSSGTSGGNTLYAFHNDGTPVSGWPVTLAAQTFYSPMLVDVNGDGVLDVVADDDSGTLYAFKGNGSSIFQMQPKKANNGTVAGVLYEMAAAQMGSNNPVLFLGGYNITLVSGNGTQLSDDGSHGAGMLTYPTPNESQGPAVGDLDGTGTLNIVVATSSSISSDTSAQITAWNAGPVGAVQWPMFRHDAAHSAAVLPTPPNKCPRVLPPQSFYTITPCRISDSRNAGNLTYGGPSLTAGEVRTLTVTGVCNIPQTAKSVSLNITITNPTAGGFITFFPGGDGNPGTSTLNFAAGETLANNMVVPLSYDGLGHLTMQVSLPGGNTTDVVVDTNGYFQ